MGKNEVIETHSNPINEGNVEKAEFFGNARKDLSGPLSGIRVLEATTTWAGPMAGCLLADYGAEVIKVESPEGEVLRELPPIIPNSDLSILYETVNRNKQNLSLTLSTSEGREIFLALVKDFDVVIENFRPGTLSSWGLGYEDLKKVKPDIVYLSVSGFGQYGDLHERVGYDPVAQAYSGMMSLNGDVQGEPMKAPTFLGDDLSGLHGAFAVLAALQHKNNTGEGQHVDVSLVDSLIYHTDGFATSAALGIPQQRTGNEFSLAAPVSTYNCLDGPVFAGVVLDTHWQKLLVLMDRADLKEDVRYVTNAARVKHRDEVNKLLGSWCSKRAKADIVTIFSDAGLPCSVVNSFTELVKEKHVADRGLLQEVELSDGQTIPLTGACAKFSRTPASIRTPAQPLGAQTVEILKGLGYTTETISRLKDKGIV